MYGEQLPRRSFMKGVAVLTSGIAISSAGTIAKPMYYGIYNASVVANNDPTGKGRVTLKIPQVLGTAVSNWATPAGVNFAAVPSSGTFLQAAFIGGDVNHPTYFYTPISAPLITNSLNVSAVTGATSSALIVTGNTNAGQLAFFKQTGITDHAMTVNLATGGSGGSSQAALNVVSDNNNFSTLEVTGAELNRGTIKIAHKGQASGSDASAAGISIDLQTVTGGSTGTAAQGIFITSTTDTIPGGNAIDVRYNSSDWFVVKGNVGAGNGIVGIGIATGHIPAGMLEIAQKDTTTVGLYMSAIASGADMIQLKDSSGNLRFEVNNAGNTVHRANALFTASAVIGSTSASGLGGAGSAVQIYHTTDPTSNPTTGSVLLYCDVSGNLLARTQAGNVRTVAAV